MCPSFLLHQFITSVRLTEKKPKNRYVRLVLTIVDLLRSLQEAELSLIKVIVSTTLLWAMLFLYEGLVIAKGGTPELSMFLLSVIAHCFKVTIAITYIVIFDCLSYTPLYETMKRMARVWPDFLQHSVPGGYHQLKFPKPPSQLWLVLAQYTVFHCIQSSTVHKVHVLSCSIVDKSSGHPILVCDSVYSAAKVLMLAAVYFAAKVSMLAASVLCSFLYVRWLIVVKATSGIYALSALNKCLASVLQRHSSVYGVVLYLSDILLFSQQVLEKGNKLYVMLQYELIELTLGSSSCHATKKAMSLTAMKGFQKVPESRLIELVLTSRHKIIGREFMPSNDDSWITEGMLTREGLLKPVLSNGHSEYEASSLVDSCLRDNGQNQRAALEWLSFLRWSKCKASLAICYEEKLGKLRIDNEGSLVQESGLCSLRSLFTSFLPLVEAKRAQSEKE